MADTLELQKVKGKLFNLRWLPKEAAQIKVSLSENLVLYKNSSQIIGDERIVTVDSFGVWEVDLMETDSMSDDAHYIFEIAGRTYHKYVPINAQDWEFNDLPSALNG